MIPRPLARRFAGASLILLIVLLPGLLAGRNLDGPPFPGEYRRAVQGLSTGWDEPARAGSDVVRMFYSVGLTADLEEAAADDPAAQASLVARARLGQLLGLFGIALLTYLAVMQSQGRGRAVLTTALLCTLPVVHAEGHVLRPETPVALFGLLSLVLMQTLPQVLRPGRRRGPIPTVVVMALTCVTAAMATGLAVGCLPAYGAYLLVPGAVMAMAMGRSGLVFLRAARRRRWPYLPLRALARRLLPWTLLALLSLLSTTWLLMVSLAVPAQSLPLTATTAGLLPEHLLLRVPLIVLLALGAFGFLVRLGLRLGRQPRLFPELILGVHAAVLLLSWWLRGGDMDALPAAMPAAVLLTEGVVMVVVMVALRQARVTARQGPGAPLP